MKISRDKLLHMIQESISRVVLKEYGGEQLVLPFDGDTRAYNYMQYVDFVKSITKPGEITSNIRNVDDYYKYVNVNDELLFTIGMNSKFYNGYCREEFSDEEYEIVLGKLEDQYGELIYGENNNHPWSSKYNIGEELSDEGFKYLANYLINIGKSDIKWVLQVLFKNSNGDGMVYINRVLSIPSSFKRYTGEDDMHYNSLYDLYNDNYSDLGHYWAYGTDTGNAYWSSNFEGGNSYVSLIAMTPIENIDIAETCGVDSVGENEVYFYDDRKIMLVGLTVDGKEINIGHRVYK